MEMFLKDLSTKKFSTKILREASYWAIFVMYSSVVAMKILEFTVYQPMALTFVSVY